MITLIKIVLSEIKFRFIHLFKITCPGPEDQLYVEQDKIRTVQGCLGNVMVHP